MKDCIQSCNLTSLDDNYGAFDVNLRDVTNNDDNSELYLLFTKRGIKYF